MSNSDLNIPDFLKRKETPPKKETAAAAKKFADEAKKKKLDAAKAQVAKVAAAAAPVVAKFDEQKAMTPHAKTAMERINEERKKDGLRPFKPKAAVPKKAGKAVEKAIKERDALAAKAKAISAANGKTPPKPKAKKSGRYDWAGAEEAAAKGTIPTTPDFSANTHKCYRPRLAEIEKLVKKGDVKSLKAMKESDFRKDGSPLIMNRYRKLAITALEAKRGR